MIDYVIRPVKRAEVRDFIEKHHYSHNINGLMSSYCFAMYDTSGHMVGAMIYGHFGMASVWKKYADNPQDVIELRRLVLVDDTPKNAESFFLGWTLRWLKRNTTLKTIISYADPNYGHSGVIYRATNFVCVGMTAPGRVISYRGKLYHDKAIRTKYKGELKPFARLLRDALLSGEAEYIKQKPKYIYRLELDKKRHKRLQQQHQLDG